MDGANGLDTSEETIQIDIQDTVSATVDNKLEYTASTQAPSFADLFPDVKPPATVNSGDGDGLVGSGENCEDQYNSKQAEFDFKPQESSVEDKIIPQEENNANPATDAKTSPRESEAPLPPVVPLSQLLDIDSSAINVQHTPQEKDSGANLLLQNQQDNETVTTEGENKDFQTKLVENIENSEVGDNVESRDLDDGVDLSELLKSQAKSNEDDFDDEFEFESPPKKTPAQQSLPIVRAKEPTEDRSEKYIQQSATPVQEPAASVSQCESQDEAADENNLKVVEDEWDSIQTVTPTFGDSSIVRPEGMSSKIITYEEAHDAFLESNLDQYLGSIVRSVHRSGFKKLKHALFGPSRLHRDLIERRDQYLCMTQYCFENNNRDHVRMLQTIYKQLTGAKFDCPRTGSHWEHIGFQGNDPTTDLRGCGMLGLLHLIFITTSQKYLPLTREIYKLSLHETQNFPFCIMGINMTRMTVQALREDCLNKDLNRHARESTFMLHMMRFYMAAFYHLNSIWKSQHKTVADSGFVLRDVEEYLKKNPSRLMADLDKRISSSNVALATEIQSEPAIQFSKFNDD